MDKLRPQRIFSLITAFLVLIGGLLISIFLPTGLSPMARIIIAVLVILYFLLRMKMIWRKKPLSESE